MTSARLGRWHLTPKTEYASDVDDLAVDFYEPAMSGAMCYDRSMATSPAALYPTGAGFALSRPRRASAFCARLPSPTRTAAPSGWAIRPGTIPNSP
jgi:hypothetical protein